MDAGPFIGRLISIGMASAAAGVLVQVCNFVKEEALRANQTGLISLSRWNRMLERGGR